MQDRKDDIEGGEVPQHAHMLALFETLPQLLYVAAITLASGVLAGAVPAACSAVS